MLASKKNDKNADEIKRRENKTQYYYSFFFVLFIFRAIFSWNENKNQLQHFQFSKIFWKEAIKCCTLYSKIILLRKLLKPTIKKNTKPVYCQFWKMIFFFFLVFHGKGSEKQQIWNKRNYKKTLSLTHKHTLWRQTNYSIIDVRTFCIL